MSKAVDKNGKELTGAAKNSFVQKCKRDACAAKAVDKNGTALADAAKNSFMQKCEKERLISCSPTRSQFVGLQQIASRVY